MDITNEFDNQFGLLDEVLDVDIYEGAPDFDGPLADENDAQEDESDFHVGHFKALFKASSPEPRHWEEALAWYRNHSTEAEIGFDVDRACLKICRTARNIPAKYLTARECMLATPEANRFYEVDELRRGMVVHYADPNDSNTADHIATVMGRVRGFDPDDLHDVLVKTNGVLTNQLVVVRGDYFVEHWGDPFKFGANWINGVEIDYPAPRGSKVERFNAGGPVYDLNLLAKAGKNRPKPKAVLARIEEQVKMLPDNPKLVRVREFKDEWRAERTIDLSLLDAAVNSGNTGVVKRVRDQIRRLIETLPDE